VAACRKPGVSIAAVALANSLNANLLRRWVVAEERAQPGDPNETVSTPPLRLDVDNGSFIPLRVAAPVLRNDQPINIELRRGATLIKVAWPQSAGAECANWLRELLR
jgi:transposase-like protein